MSFFSKMRLSTGRMVITCLCVTSLLAMFSFTLAYGANVRAKEDISSTKVFKTLETTDVNGAAFTSEDLAKSRISLVNVWTTTCPTCIGEMPDLDRLSDFYDASELQVVGVCYDVCPDGKTVDEENKAEELRIISESGAAYTQILPDEGLASFFKSNVSGTPTTFVVNDKGSILKYTVGGQSFDGWKEYVEEALGSGNGGKEQ